MAPNAGTTAPEVELVEFLDTKHHPTWSSDVPDKDLWTNPPPNPYSGFKEFAEELKKDEPVIITNYLEEGFDHYFVLTHRAEGFINLLDALNENASQGHLAKKPPIGTWVVARLPSFEGSFKDSLFPYLLEIGGLLAKPWRGVVVGHKLEKAIVYLTDLGVCETLDKEYIYKMSEEVGAFPIDAFGTWVSIDSGVTEEKRQFYMHKFAFLMLNVVFTKAFVTKVRKISRMRISVDLKVDGKMDQPMVDLATKIRDMQLWGFEKAAKTLGSSLTPKMLLPESERITLEDIVESSRRWKGVSMEGEIETLEGARVCVKKLPNAKLDVEKKIWSIKCAEYFFKFRPDPTWFPIESEVFLLRTKDAAKHVKFRRCSMVNRTVRDLDDLNFRIRIESKEFERIPPRDMRQAPVELLQHPFPFYENVE